MHTAGGYLDQKTRSPVSMGAAIAINGAIIGALLFAKPELLPVLPDIIEVYPVPAEKLPEPIKERIEPKVEMQQPARQLVVSKTPVKSDDTEFTKASDSTILPGTIGGTVEGTGVISSDPPHNPIFVGPEIERRFLKDFQPPYPPGMQRLGEEGVVVVRVLVGPDGRVKRVERVEAADTAFFLATEAQALKKWRFKPATRDGVPVEGWRTMTVRFELRD